MPEKPTTIKEIAKILNVSASTVSRALSDHPSIGLTTRLKVKKLAQDLNYERNEIAVFFQKGKTFTIGVILPELSEYFFSSAISAIEDTAYKRNYTVLLAQSHDDLQGMKATEILLDLLNKKNNDNEEKQAFYQVILDSELIENKKE